MVDSGFKESAPASAVESVMSEGLIQACLPQGPSEVQSDDNF